MEETAIAASFHRVQSKKRVINARLYGDGGDGGGTERSGVAPPYVCKCATHQPRVCLYAYMYITGSCCAATSECSFFARVCVLSVCVCVRARMCECAGDRDAADVAAAERSSRSLESSLNDQSSEGFTRIKFIVARAVRASDRNGSLYLLLTLCLE